MFGYKNPLNSVEFELTQTAAGLRRHSRVQHSPFDEINLNLVEEQHPCSGAAGSGVEELQLQNFQIVNGGVYKKFAHAIATIDIVYSLLRLAIHFLDLLTGGVGFRHGNTYTYSLQHHHAAFVPAPNQNSTPVPAILEDDPSIQPYALSSDDSPHFTTPMASRTLIVTIWAGKFIVCIVQLIVASALYSAATNMKDSRLCIRNCHIWMWTSGVLIILIVFELCGIAMLGNASGHVVALSVLAAELLARTVGLLIVWRYVRQLKFQICDLEQDEHIIYYELCPSPGPGPTNATGTGSSSRPMTKSSSRSSSQYTSLNT